MFKVAFATDDRVAVNQHFGATVGFAIYALDAERARLVQVAEFPPESMDGNENKLAEKIAALAGCAAVYCLAVGGSAVRQLLAGGIQPVRMEDETAIEPLLVQLRTAIREGGIAWIDNALRRQPQQGQDVAATPPLTGCEAPRGLHKLVKREGDGSRFDRMAEEGWQE